MNTEQYEEDMQRDAAHEGQGASADPMRQTDTTSAGETVAPRKRAPRRKVAEADAGDAGTPAPRTRRRKTASKDDVEGVTGAEGAADSSAEEPAAKTAKRVSRSRRKPAADVAADQVDAVSADPEATDAEGAAVDAEAKPRRARTPRASTRRSKVASVEDVTANEEPVSEDGLSDVSASVAPVGEASDDDGRAQVESGSVPEFAERLVGAAVGWDGQNDNAFGHASSCSLPAIESEGPDLGLTHVVNATQEKYGPRYEHAGPQRL